MRLIVHPAGGALYSLGSGPRGLIVPSGSAPSWEGASVSNARTAAATLQDPRDSWAISGYVASGETRVFGDGWILVEPSVQNVVPNSHDFSDPPFDHLQTPTITDDDFLSPDGSDLADELDFSPTNNQQVRDNLNAGLFTAGETSTWVCWLRSATSDTVTVFFRDKDSTTQLNESIVMGSAWARVERQVSNGGGGATAPLWALIDPGGGPVFHAWGAQLQVDMPFATTLIPTAAGAATRDADEVTLSSADPWAALLRDGDFEISVRMLHDSTVAIATAQHVLYGAAGRELFWYYGAGGWTCQVRDDVGISNVATNVTFSALDKITFRRVGTTFTVLKNDVSVGSDGARGDWSDHAGDWNVGHQLDTHAMFISPITEAA